MKLTHSPDFSAVIGYRMTGPINPAEAEGALESLAPMLEPVTSTALLRAAGECFAACKARPDEATDLKVFASVLAKDLCEFPEDVVVTAFERWRRNNVFRPSVAEIRKACFDLCKSRRSLAHQLRNPHPALGLAPAKGKTWATMTETQRAEFDAKLAACRAALSGPKPIGAVVAAAVRGGAA